MEESIRQRCPSTGDKPAEEDKTLGWGRSEYKIWSVTKCSASQCSFSLILPRASPSELLQTQASNCLHPPCQAL